MAEGGEGENFFVSFVKSLGGGIPLLKGIKEEMGDWSALKAGFRRAIEALSAFANQYIRLTAAMGFKLVTVGFVVGAQLVQGVINGIRSKIAEAEGTILSFAARMIAAAQNKFIIHSPSQVFFQIGKDVAQGFIDGIAAMKASTQAAMASILDVSGVKGLTKKDASGVQLLTEITNKIAQLNIVTEEQRVRQELTKKAYEGTNAAIIAAIIIGAKYIDRLNEEKAAIDAIRASLDATMDHTGMGRDQLGGGETGGFPMPGGGIDEDEGFPPPPIDPWDDFWTMMKGRLDEFRNSLPSMKQAIGENLLSGIQAIGDVFANAVANWDGTAKGFFKSLAQGFRQMISQIISELVRVMVMKAILNLIGGIAGGAMGGGSSGSVGGGLSGGTSHSGGFASGGRVQGPGTSTSDSIWASLSQGEFVMSARAVSKFGSEFFERLNMGQPQLAFASGGAVSSSSTYNNSSYSNPTVNIYMQGGGGTHNTRDQIERAVIAGLQKAQMRNK
jgi:hypothetical protein